MIESSKKSWYYGNSHDNIRSCDYDKVKEDDGMSSNDCTHANINHTVTF